MPVLTPTRVGLYGGAFDPPHRAHVAMAQAFVAQCGLQRLYVVPTGGAWHKPTRLSAPEHRLAMAHLAFADVPQVVVDGRELWRPGASYTIDTLESLGAAHPGAQWHLLMGQDQWANFAQWHRWQAIAEMAAIFVANRSINTSADAHKTLKFPGDHPSRSAHAQRLDWTPMTVSSTEVRARLSSATDTADSALAMVPTAVARYISQHQLYTPKTP